MLGYLTVSASVMPVGVAPRHGQEQLWRRACLSLQDSRAPIPGSYAFQQALPRVIGYTINDTVERWGIGVFAMILFAHALNSRNPAHSTLKLLFDTLFDGGLSSRFLHWLCHIHLFPVRVLYLCGMTREACGPSLPASMSRSTTIPTANFSKAMPCTAWA